MALVVFTFFGLSWGRGQGAEWAVAEIFALPSTLAPCADGATAVLIIFWLTDLGLLLDGRRWGIAAEVVRILMLCALLTLGTGALADLGWSVAIVSLLLLSAMHLLIIQRDLDPAKVEVIDGDR